MSLWEKADLQLPWCLRVVVTLGIADRISEGRSTLQELADASGCDGEVLGRLLTYLVSKGIFEQPQSGVFQLNESARGLLDPATKIGLDLNGIGGRMAGAWATLPAYVRTGKPAYREAFGLPFWDDLEAHPDVAASFDALIGPTGHGDFNGHFDIAGEWASVRTIVDVGGGTGAMLAAMLKLHPQVRGTLVDLPHAVERAAAILRAASVVERVTLVGQSFFEPLPPGADLYLLRGILNNWDDEDAILILKRCTEAARPDGRVVILKSVKPENEAIGLSIEAVLLAGKHRSVSEFRVLAERSGLALIAAGQQSSGYFVVECRPVVHG